MAGVARRGRVALISSFRGANFRGIGIREQKNGDGDLLQLIPSREEIARLVGFVISLIAKTQRATRHKKDSRSESVTSMSAAFAVTPASKKTAEALQDGASTTFSYQPPSGRVSLF